MPKAIETMECERQSETELDQDLSDDWKCAERSHHRRRLKVPAEQRCGEVGGGKEVETTGKNDSRETIKTAHDPGDLELVDCKVGGDWAVKTLFGEDFILIGGLGCWGGGGCGWSVVVQVSIRADCVCVCVFPGLSCRFNGH